MSVIQELPLVSTIAIGLSAAFVCGFIATKFRLSPLVGYLLAGIIIGPHSPGFIADIDIAEQLSEIGIVLLMFGVGLHFSITDFMEVRRIATVGAIVRIAIVTYIGYFLATLWGWSTGAGLIFGLCLSVASTVVLLRTLEENHLMQTITGRISIGWLIVEDIAMILAMVMIPALATTKAVIGPEEGHSVVMQLGIALGKVGLFAAIMVVAGRRVLPWLLSAVSRTGSRELFTLAAFCMAMGIAFGASILFGVSLALGAFFAGMMIRESDLNHEVADRVLPFQDAFAVLFFVAVGMLFDPSILVDSPDQVLITVLVIMLGKGLLTFGIMRIFGYTNRVSLKISVGLAQIGEFSFILIALGTSLGLMPPEERNLILAGALISIALNPILFRMVRQMCDRREGGKIPDKDELAHLNDNSHSKKEVLLLIGFGRVGGYVASMLKPDDYYLVIVDTNREKIEQLRNLGFHAIAGDATQKETLIEAQIEKASVIFITVPDPFEARRAVEQVRALNPDARVLVRSHNDEETAFFESQNVELAVTATEEIARRMVTVLGAGKA